MCEHRTWRGARAATVSRVHLLVPQGEHLLHGRDARAGEAVAVLAHLDGLQPLGHRPEHGAVTAAGARQADGHSAGGNVNLHYSLSFTATACTLNACEGV